ncbi:ribose 5-phosphate isomerase B [Candidatus Babeliales bacterium]|nr:ribose 5-phosphate isomerase B [Candidatus Babeliales bacterium]MBY0353449.1 ribose 5-phosphate isomerase B [Candidatus Babeliales bacterium]
MIKISIGADHRGFALKKHLINHFQEYAWSDQGTHTDERTDYPLYAKRVCQEILSGQADVGIVLCGSGVGMAIAANRFKGIYAALCWNEEVARMARSDDGANVLVLAADFTTPEQAVALVKAWLSAEFKGEQYQKRLEMLDNF